MNQEAGGRVGDYQLLERLGAGGCGVVYRARHTSTGGEVALKTLLQGAEAEDVLRFQREGEAMARLRHPNLLQVHGLFAHEGRPVLVMELGSGSLADRLRTGPLDWPAAVQLTQGLCSALTLAHEAGILHRDIKPDNVLFGSDGNPKLADFGLAQLDGRSRLTQTGTVMGTPAFMAPEQAQGEAGPASDLYSLAAVLFQCVAGRPPLSLEGGLVRVLACLATETPPRLRSLVPDVPPQLDELVAQSLAKTPAERPSLAEFTARLQSGAGPAPASAGLGAAAGVALALALLSLVGLGGLLWSQRSAAEAQQPQVATEPPPPVPAERPRSRFPTEVIDAATLLNAAIDAHGEEAFGDATLSWETLNHAADRLTSNPWPLLAESHDARIPSAMRRPHLLRLGRAGHTLALRLLLRDSVGSSASDQLLRCAASIGDDNAFQRLDRVQIERALDDANSKDRRLRRCYRYLSYATQLDVSHLDILDDLTKKVHLEVDHAGAAWVEVWQQEHGEVLDVRWRKARNALREGDAHAAVEGYLTALEDERVMGDPSQLRAELRSAAEHAWQTELLAHRAPFSMGLPLPQAHHIELEVLLEQAERVFAVTRWPRGHYWRALIHLANERQRGSPDVDPV